MRLLILTDPFGAPSYAPRMRNLATNLQKDGWEVTVITEKIPTHSFSTTDFTLLQMPYYTNSSKIRHCLQWIADKAFRCKERHFLHFVQQQVNILDFDWILCSTFSDFPLWTAQRLHMKYNIPLAVDLRDIIEQWGNTSYTSNTTFLQRLLRKAYEHRAIRLRNRVLHMAQLVTTISPWHVEQLRPFNTNTHLIYNGFDPDCFYPSDQTSDHFILSYIGRIYDFNLRNPLPLFSALHTLLDEYPDIKKHLLLKFFIEPQCIQMVTKAIQNEQLEKNSTVQSFIPLSEAVQQMHLSSICVLLTNTPGKNGPFGIMTTKFYEMLGIEKPILCIPSDNGCLADVIHETNAGIASDNTEEIKNFILDKYNEWKQNGFTHQPVRNIEQFNRKNQAKQFEDLFCHSTRL